MLYEEDKGSRRGQRFSKRTKVLEEDKCSLFASICYGTLANLRKIKNFTTFTTKHLAESLIISRLDFGDIVFYPGF